MKHWTEFDPKRVWNTYPVSKRDMAKDVYWTKECDDLCEIDIEVSTAYINKDGVTIPYEAGKTEEYWNSMEDVAIPYEWTFGVEQERYYGRSLEEIPDFLSMLPLDYHIIIYVHNLSYEFQFFMNILSPFAQVFSREAHKPIYFISQKFPQIEFRCSYMLTRMKLDDWGKQIGLPKLHTLAYDSKIRTPKSELSEEEWAYCERDIDVMYEGLKVYRERYGHVAKIPFTQTGEVRRELKSVVLKNKSLHRHLISILPENAEMYSHMKKTFAGGYTHGNVQYVDGVVKGEYDYNSQKVGFHWDFCSSYPAVLLSEKFPCGKFTPAVWYKKDSRKNATDKYAYLMRVRFYKVEEKTYNHYISESKCFVPGDECKKVRLFCDNGRVVSNMIDGERVEFEMWLTEVDMEIIKKTYNIKYDVVECYKSVKSYLPIEYVKYILELYVKKTKLKGVAGREAEYVVAKQFINSIFGMMVTDLLQDEVECTGYADKHGKYWNKHCFSVDDVDKYLEDLKSNNKGRTFVCYAWGIWCCAYGRKNLWDCILKGDDGDENNKIVYCDTDSIFCTDWIDFSDYNEKITAKINACLDHYGIDRALAAPCDKKGVAHPLGVFEENEEERWTEFVTLGAKRYCVREIGDGKLHLTVSGINKGAVGMLDDNIENFNVDLSFDKDSIGDDGVVRLDDEGLPCVSKKLIRHRNNMPKVVFNRGQYDEWESDLRFGITMRNTSYSMSWPDAFYQLVMSTDVISHLDCIKY